jgi:hypothetical protein
MKELGMTGETAVTETLGKAMNFPQVSLGIFKTSTCY